MDNAVRLNAKAAGCSSEGRNSIIVDENINITEFFICFFINNLTADTVLSIDRTGKDQEKIKKVFLELLFNIIRFFRQLAKQKVCSLFKKT